ncbi:MAG: hypothetical protein R8M46_05435 [Ghiorsea sp.]
MNIFKKIGFTFMTLLFTASLAHAVAPANSIITNTATLTYTGNAAGTTASVDVSVSLVPVAPTILAATAVTAAEGQTATLTYKIKSNSNGPDVYSFNAPSSVATLVTGSGVQTTLASISLGINALGATAAKVLSNIGSASITVPADGVADTNVNGIKAGDTVVIALNAYLVASVVDNATADSTIVLTTNLLTTVNPGNLISEQQSFTVDITTGTVTAPNTAGTEVVSVVAKASNGSASTSAAGTVNVVKVIYTKSVKVNAGAFVTATPTVVSSDILTYRMLMSVPANSTLLNVLFTDTVPTFMNYVLNSTTLDVDGPLGATLPANVADVAGSTALVGGVSINSLGQAAGTVVGGVAGVEVSVEFQVTVQ